MMYATYPQMLQKKITKQTEKRIHYLQKSSSFTDDFAKKKKTIKAKRQWNYVFSVLEKKPINLELYIQQKYLY